MTTQIDLLVAVPTAEPAPPLAPAAGPTARLVALPQPRGGVLSTSSGLDEHLAQLELRPWLITCSDCASPPDMAQGGPRR